MNRDKDMARFMIASILAAVIGAGSVYLITDNIIAAIIVVIAVLVAYLVGILAYKNVFRRIDDIRESIENPEDDTFMELSEGELSKLYEAINKMQSVLKESKEKELKEKEYLKDLIYDISHQIKTPVASLTLFNDILTDDLDLKAMSDDERKNILQQCEMQLERIKWLVQSMLRLARLEAQAVTFEMEDTSAKHVAELAVGVLKAKLAEKNQRVNINGDAEIKVDIEWFQEALINIIKNASDYGPSDSDIDISVSKTPICTKISIKDNGPGIREEDRLNIFKRFYRSDMHELNPNSVGIGLALSKSIIENHGGSIRVESLHESELSPGEKSYTNMVITI